MEKQTIRALNEMIRSDVERINVLNYGDWGSDKDKALHQEVATTVKLLTDYEDKARQSQIETEKIANNHEIEKAKLEVKPEKKPINWIAIGELAIGLVGAGVSVMSLISKNVMFEKAYKFESTGSFVNMTTKQAIQDFYKK